VQIGSTLETVTSFSDATSKKGVLYIYLVTATVNRKQSGPSNQVKISR
jgi:hypothetical protein